MPSSGEILELLTTASHELAAFAIAWHVAVLAVAAALLGGSPPGVPIANASARARRAADRRELGEPVVVMPPLTYTPPVVITHQPFDAEAARRKEREERAARVAAMLERWAAEDVSDEPEWDVDQIPRIELHKLEAPAKPGR